MTPAGIVGEPLDIHDVGTKTERHERVRDLLATVGLNPDFGERYPHEFSGGQRQRIGVARALALEPGPHRRRRADQRPRRVDPGPDHQPARAAPGPVRADLPVHRPRPVGGPPHQRPDRGDVPRPDRRAGRDRATSTASRSTRTRSRSCRRSRSRTRSSSRAAAGSSSRATCRPRPTRRRAAASTPAAGCASGSATRSAAPTEDPELRDARDRPRGRLPLRRGGRRLGRAAPGHRSIRRRRRPRQPPRRDGGRCHAWIAGSRPPRPRSHRPPRRSRRPAAGGRQRPPDVGRERRDSLTPPSARRRGSSG